MRRATRISVTLSAAVLALGAAAAVQAQQASNMTFFVTSAGLGKGADLGGLDGADAQCNALAKAAGSKLTNWRAYLSTTKPGGEAGDNARDRIGKGPWRNAKGVVIAKNISDLHSDNNKITKQTALTEKGTIVNGRGDTPNMHDILTGTQADGTAFPAGEDRTCANWTSSDAGAAMVGHGDRIGLNESPPMKSWNTSHPSRACNMDALKATGGAGLIYCFAAD